MKKPLNYTSTTLLVVLLGLSIMSGYFIVRYLPIFSSSVNLGRTNNVAAATKSESKSSFELLKQFFDHDEHTHSQDKVLKSPATNVAPIQSPPLVTRAKDVSPIIPDVITLALNNAMVPVLYSIMTKQPVVFLTIDDGEVKDPSVRAYMIKHGIVATLFLNDSKISDNYDYFKRLQSDGSPIENHTLNHLNLTKLSYAQQKKEICDNADKFTKVFGKKPTLFRPPYGAFNDITRKAAADCGMKALIHWHAKANGGAMQYQQGNKLQPGDIVLMHFRTEVMADLTAFLNAAQAAQLRPVLLEDWLH